MFDRLLSTKSHCSAIVKWAKVAFHFFFLFVHFPWLIRPIPHDPAELAGLPDTSVSYVGHYIPILEEKKVVAG